MASREFQIFVKPVGPSCNLGCSYCYYLGKQTLFTGELNSVMTDDLLEKYIIQHVNASTEELISFSWHGGEPLLAGIEFYKKAIKLQQKYKPEGKVIVNGIQTNGTLINREWSGFLASEGFVVGVSIDGPAELHNKNRRTKDGRTTLDEVLRGYKLLKEYGIIPEILCVVSAENVKYPLLIYNFFKELGAKYITFLPLAEYDPAYAGSASERSVPALEFGHFLSAIFDEWVAKDIGEIKVQIFEEAARTAFNQEHTLCIFKVDCGGVPVIEHSGDFFSCDHYVDDNHKIGNIRDLPVSWLLDSDIQRSFGQAKSISLPGYCHNCEVKKMCNGECPKNRFIKSPDGEEGLNYLCSGYRFFFNHIRPFVDAIADTWKNQII